MTTKPTKKYDPRVDAYLDASAPFAKPILSHLRRLVHAVCPEAQETIRWGMPYFECRGLLCGMAAFKAHCGFVFWKGRLIPNLHQGKKPGMGSLGKIKSLADLPPDEALRAWIREAALLNEKGVNKARPEKPPKPKVPAYVTEALKENPETLRAFEGFSPSHQREYLEWITEAKTEEARRRRLEAAIEGLIQGKPRNWKYIKK